MFSRTSYPTVLCHTHPPRPSTPSSDVTATCAAEGGKATPPHPEAPPIAGRTEHATTAIVSMIMLNPFTRPAKRADAAEDSVTQK
jgi:hypothetical protein